MFFEDEDQTMGSAPADDTTVMGDEEKKDEEGGETPEENA